MRIDVTSALTGLTTPVNSLYKQIAKAGWEVSKVKWDTKVNQFVAEGKNVHGEKISKTGPDDRMALGNLLVAIMRHNHMRTAAQWKVGMWKTVFTDQLQPIAEAYAKAPVYDPKAAAYFKELADDSVRRADVLKHQLHIEVTDNPEPYANAQEMAKDIHQKRHFMVSRANATHPLWSLDQNIAFRIVHDVLGHAVSGGDFGWQGENMACAAHFPLLTPTAQQALFTECIAQTAYAAFYRSFGPQKVALFPQFTDPATAAENNPGHAGVHPSQATAPTAMPSVAPSPAAPDARDPGYIAPHQEAFGLTPLMSKVAASVLTDPNQGWDSHILPMQVPSHGVGNAYLDHGDPLESQNVMDTASKIDTNWANLKRGDGSPDIARMKQAIVNAFRVVLLSPRKDLRWNAIHYQDISHVPAGTDDPKVYWDTLEHKRQNWNGAQARKLFEDKVSPETLEQMVNDARISHQAWRKLWPQFYSLVYQMTGDRINAKDETEQLLYNWYTEEHQRLMAEDEKKPEDKQKPADEIERRAGDALVKRMKLFLADSQPKLDITASAKNYIDELATKILNECSEQEIPDGYSHDEIMTLFREYALLALTKGEDTTMEDVHDAWAAWMSEHEKDHKSIKPFEDLTDKVKEYDRPYMEYIHKHSADTLFEQPLPEPQEKIDRYGAFMGTHLKAIAQISQHVDELLQAALKDVHDHDGTGHHFRARVLQLGISGVGPKVASFAWLLLQPMTSQLGTIDTHMMDVLGHNYEKEMNTRDYFKFERELAAGRDAAGYSHIPLGAFQWGMWDFKRTGPGSHQDHSAMRVLDPISHDNIDWASKQQPIGADGAQEFKQNWAQNAPDWWKNTQHARDAVADDWDNGPATTVPQNQVPYQTVDSILSKIAVKETHKGIELKDGRMIWWDPAQGDRTHVEYMTNHGIEPDDVNDYLRRYDDGDEERLKQYYGDFWDKEYARQNPQWKFAKVATEGSEDEFHIGITIPEEIITKIADWTGSISWPEGTELEKPEDYHMTLFWSPNGWSDEQNHKWVESRSDEARGIRFKGASLDGFPGADDKTALVLRFESEYGSSFAEKMMNEADERGLEIKKFSGGWKAHITVGWLPEGEAPKEKLPLEFASQGLYVSIPRPLRKKEEEDSTLDKFFSAAGPIPWYELEGRHEGHPGQTIMQHATQTLGMSTPTVWKLIANAGKR